MLDLVAAAAGGVVAGYALARGMHRPRRETAQNAARAVSWECVCGRTFWDDHQAKEHAIETHNAPPQHGEWRFLYTEVTA